MTANFGTDSKNQLDMFKKLQPGKPLVAMEYWTGGTDYWGANVSDHQTAATFGRWYQGILEYPASVNIYMFHGGTDFGFLNGALNLESSEMEGSTLRLLFLILVSFQIIISNIAITSS